MTKLFAAAALIAAIATPALAKNASEQKSFTRDGETFVYTATEKNDATILTGRSGSGRDFRLVVRNGYVHGFGQCSRIVQRAEGDCDADRRTRRSLILHDVVRVR